MIVGHKKPPLDEALLRHYGVKGMHWGIRKKEETSNRSSGSASSAAAYKAVKHKQPTPREAAVSIRKRQTTFLEKANPPANDGSVKKGLTPGQKKALLIGAGALAAAAVVGGAAYAHHKGYLGGGNKNDIGDLSRKYLDQVTEAKHNAWASMDSFIQPSSYERKPFTLPAGHQFHRFSRKPEYHFGRATYSTHNLEDWDRYLGHGFGAVVENNVSSAYHVTWTSKAPVKVPDLTTTLDTLKDVMNSQIDRTKPVTHKEVLDQYTELSGGHWQGNVVDGLFNALKSKGYGALVDEMDAGVVGDSPIVIFAHELMNEKQPSKPLTIQDVLKAKKAVLPLKNPKLVIKEAIK